jgi:hypothetical protein
VVDSNKRRVNITIGDAELAMAKASGESVSGYITRLIREDNDGAALRVPMPDAVAMVLRQSGVMEGPRAGILRAEVAALVLRHADEALLDSRQRIKAVLIDMTMGED